MMFNHSTIFTNKHAAYEAKCKKMFVGQTIQKLIYGEIDYHTAKKKNFIGLPESCKTIYNEIDTIDIAFYLKTDKQLICISWDTMFTCFGLRADVQEKTQGINDFEKKWDVSKNKKWKPFVGLKIVDFKIMWLESQLNTVKSSIRPTLSPQTFKITTENNKSIYITAAEINECTLDYSMQADNLLVTDNYILIENLETTSHSQMINSEQSMTSYM